MSKTRKPRPFNPYRILGVKRQATAEEIRRAYRRLSLEFHPDRKPGDRAAEARYKEIQNAYEVLGDPERRRHFDETGEVGRRAAFSDAFINVMQVIAWAVENGLKFGWQNKINLPECDFLELIRVPLLSARKDCQENLRLIDACEATLKKASTRITIDGENVFDEVIALHLHLIKRDRAAVQTKLERVDGALEYLSKCRYHRFPGHEPRHAIAITRLSWTAQGTH